MSIHALNIHFDVGGSQVIVEIDGSDKTTVSGNMTLSVDLDEGEHHIKCMRISRYTKRSCYFNILNPIHFFNYALFKVENRMLFAYDAETPSMEAIIELNQSTDISINLDVLCWKNDFNCKYYYFNVCVPQTLKYRILRKEIPSQYILRWRLMRILPSSIFTLYAWSMMFFHTDNLIMHFAICIIYTLLTLFYMRYVMKSESVASILKE